MSLLQQLAVWQKEQAAKEYVEPYMVLQFAVLKEIARVQPKTTTELVKIKGMGPVKVRKYGDVIVDMVRRSLVRDTSPVSVPRSAQHDLFAEAHAVNDAAQAMPSAFLRGEVDYTTGEVRATEAEDDALSVTAFVTMVDTALRAQFRDVKVRGEVVGFKGCNAKGHAYFEMKDADSVLRCAVFQDAYALSGVALEDGMEIVVTGYPNYHNRYGFSFVGRTVALAGEGALKKAYDDLKKKLAAEGLLAPTRKRSLPQLPARIGLITSRTGAAIGDFMSNVGHYGYTIRFHHTSVEGAHALTELRTALHAMAKEKIDVLVVVRGGGSLESLQAFNNETIVRMIADFPVPVVVGVGHEQDETLATLVADVGVSTPTAAARAVRSGWDHYVTTVHTHAQRLQVYGGEMMHVAHERLTHGEHTVVRHFDAILQRMHRVFHAFASLPVRLQADMRAMHKTMHHHSEEMVRHCHRAIAFARARTTLARAMRGMDVAIQHRNRSLAAMDKLLVQHSPQRQLQLGYSITRTAQGAVVRSVHDVAPDQPITVRVADGDIAATVR